MAENNVYTHGKARMVVDDGPGTRRDRNCKYFINNIEVPRDDFVAYCHLLNLQGVTGDPKLLTEDHGED